MKTVALLGAPILLLTDLAAGEGPDAVPLGMPIYPGASA